MIREKKFFDTHFEADKYVDKKKGKGYRLLSISYKETDFFSFLMGVHGYIYKFIWDK